VAIIYASMETIATTSAAVAAGAAIVATITILMILILYAGGLKRSEGFFTEYATEEPTRSYVPYAGTIPFGEWGTGVQPWADVIPAPPYAWRTMPWIDPTPITPGGPLL
jgi:hypothetical protein